MTKVVVQELPAKQKELAKRNGCMAIFFAILGYAAVPSTILLYVKNPDFNRTLISFNNWLWVAIGLWILVCVLSIGMLWGAEKEYEKPHDNILVNFGVAIGFADLTFVIILGIVFLFIAYGTQILCCGGGLVFLGFLGND